MIQLKDQMGRTMVFSKPPERIISLIPSITELIVDLGLKEKLVGVTKFCVHPTDIREEKRVVGGTKGVRMERIRALKPDLILCNKEENTKEMVEELMAEFPCHISDINTIEESYELIQQYGEIFQIQERANRLNEEIKRAIEDFDNFTKDLPSLKVGYFIWRKPWMVVGSNTFVNHLLERNNFQNIYANQTRYPEVELEKLAEKEADYILLSSEPFPFGEKHKQEILPYVGGAKVIFVDGEYFSWYGSRLVAAFKYFKKLRSTELK